MSGEEKSSSPVASCRWRRVGAPHNGHKVYRLPDGTNWIAPSTPSDCRSWRNNLADLRRKLGVRPEKRAPAHKANFRAVVNFQPSDRRLWREYLETAEITPLGVRP